MTECQINISVSGTDVDGDTSELIVHPLDHSSPSVWSEVMTEYWNTMSATCRVIHSPFASPGPSHENSRDSRVQRRSRNGRHSCICSKLFRFLQKE